MIIWIYAVLMIIGLAMFFATFFNIIKMTPQTRITMMIIVFLTFLIITLSSFNLETVFCKWVSTAYQCQTNSTQDIILALLGITFIILSLIATVIYSLELFVSMKNGGANNS